MKTVEEVKNRIKELKSIKTKDKDSKFLIYRELKVLEWVLEDSEDDTTINK